MRKSRFLKTLESNGIIAIFHSLTPKPIYLNGSDWLNYLEEGKKENEINSKLKEMNLLIKNEKEDESILENITKSCHDRTMSILYLILTKECNFSCLQCFQPERSMNTKKRFPVMSIDVAKRGIDSFVRHIKESECLSFEPQIQIYGGEPFLNYKTLKFSIEYITALKEGGILPNETRVVIVTNGSLVSERKVNFLAKHDVAVGLSIEGRREENDFYRRTKNGSGSYNKITSSLKLLQKANIQVSLSITITPRTVNNLPDIIFWAKNDLGINGIGFNFIGGKSYKSVESQMSKKDYDKIMSVETIKAYEEARDLDVFEDRVGRKVMDFIDGNFRIVDCGAIGNQLVIQPDGGIAFCHVSEKYNVGSVYNDNFCIFDNERIREWKKHLPVYNSECQKCYAISICGYGCFHNVEEINGKIDGLDEQFCMHPNEVMNFLIWDLYKNTQV